MLISKRRHYQEMEEMTDYYHMKLADKDKEIKERDSIISSLMNDYENIKGLNKALEERAKLLEIENNRLKED